MHKLTQRYENLAKHKHGVIIVKTFVIAMNIHFSWYEVWTIMLASLYIVDSLHSYIYFLGEVGRWGGDTYTFTYSKDSYIYWLLCPRKISYLVSNFTRTFWNVRWRSKTWWYNWFKRKSKKELHSNQYNGHYILHIFWWKKMSLTCHNIIL